MAAHGAVEVFDGLVSGPSGSPDGPGTGTPSPRPPAQARHPRERRRRRWPFVVSTLVVVALVVAGGAWFTVRQAVARYDSNIERFADPFVQIPAAERPAPPTTSAGATRALNVLLLGSDSRVSAGDATQWSYGAQRTDAIMLVHVQADRKAAQVISIPRDTWVPIPGRGNAKINAAFSWGGMPLMVRTVESLTGLHIDHVAVVDFEGFKQLTDDLGGVDIRIPKATKDERHTWTAGLHHMDGATALDYVRQRRNLPGGDFDRVKRQQNWIRAVVSKLGSSGTLRNPVALDRALTTLSKSVATDAGFGMDAIGDLVTSLSGVKPGGLLFLTMPHDGAGWSPDRTQSIVKLDRVRAQALFKAVRVDRVNDWIERYRPDLLPDVVR